jgi:hypothetical protein
MDTRIGAQSKFKYYRFQRNLIVSLVFLGLIIVLTISLFAVFIYPNDNGMQSIAFFIVLFYGIGVLFARQILLSVNMYYDYFRLIQENVPAYKARLLPFSSGFQSLLAKESYHLVSQSPRFRIYYKIFNKMPYVTRTGVSLIWIIELNDDNLEFHDILLENEISHLKDQHLGKVKYSNELTLVFKEIAELNETNKASFQEIINFSFSNRAVITIPCAVIPKKEAIYFLRPFKQYPNKYYYALTKHLFYITQGEHD